MQQIGSRGWLNVDWRLFHSVDRRDMDFEPHYHEFHKVVTCLGGHVTYIVEGSTYLLGEGDVLIIPAHQIHRSILRSSEIYERVILWIGRGFVDGLRGGVLRGAFARVDGRRDDYLRLAGEDWAEAVARLISMERCQEASWEGHQLMADTYLVQFLLTLSRLRRGARAPEQARVTHDPRMHRILTYINDHLAEALSVEALAGEFYLSASHLMRAFKQHTGTTIHQYILQKRLIRAAAAIRSGEPVTAAARLAGFSDYSAFLRAFRRQYGCAPRDLREKA